MATVVAGHRQKRAFFTPFRIFIGTAVSIMVAIVAFWTFATGWAPPRDRYPVQGVFVTAAQGDVAWPTLRANGADFAYVQASGGSTDRDPTFQRNWEGARVAGLRYGAVHRYSLCRLASDQARLFIASVPSDAAALPPAITLDFDPRCNARPSRELLLSELNTFLNEVEAHSGKPAILRITKPFEAAYSVSAGVNRTVWLIGDGFAPRYAAHPWVLWTANDWRRISGVAGPVDWTVVQP